MNKVTTTAGLLLLFIIITQTVTAQTSKWQLGVNGGVFIYQGDLTPTSIGSYATPSPVFGVNVSWVLNSYFSVRANLAVGKLRGDDAAYSDPAWRRQRNFNFSTPVTELSGLMVWNLFGNNSNELGMRLSPYVFGGAGISWLNIRRDYSRLNPDLFGTSSKERQGIITDSAKTLPGTIPVIPLGLGVQYYISPKISLTAETNFRYTFTDYLDGFSYSANPNQRDFYHSHTIGILFRFGANKNDIGCPVMKF